MIPDSPSLINAAELCLSFYPEDFFIFRGGLHLRIEVIDPDPGVCCLSFSPERFFIFHGGLHMALDVAMMGGHQVVCGACIQRQGDDAGSMVSD